MSPLLSRVEQAAKNFTRFLKNKSGDRISVTKNERKINKILNKQDKKSTCDVRTEIIEASSGGGAFVN